MRAGARIVTTALLVFGSSAACSSKVAGNASAPTQSESAPSASACDGTGPAVPDGYPALGQGCLSHFVFKDKRQGINVDPYDVSSERGVRPMPAPRTGFDMGVRKESPEGCPSCGVSFPVWIFVPSLEPGHYWLRDQASVVSETGYSFYSYSHGALVVIEGASDEAVWGRFMGKACEFPLDFVSSDSDPTTNDCFEFARGRFSAAIQDVESELEKGGHTPPPETDAYGGYPVPPQLPCETNRDCKTAKGGSCPSEGCSRCELERCR